MIVRAVLENPDLIRRIDHFNDSQNTISWLRMVADHSHYAGMTPAIRYRAAMLADRLDCNYAAWKLTRYLKSLPSSKKC